MAQLYCSCRGTAGRRPVSPLCRPRSSTPLTISGRNPPAPISASPPDISRSPHRVINLHARYGEEGVGARRHERIIGTPSPYPATIGTDSHEPGLHGHASPAGLGSRRSRPGASSDTKRGESIEVAVRRRVGRPPSLGARKGGCRPTPNTVWRSTEASIGARAEATTSTCPGVQSPSRHFRPPSSGIVAGIHRRGGHACRGAEA